MTKKALCLSVIVLLSWLSMSVVTAKPLAIERGSFGTMPDGRDVQIYTLIHAGGLRARVMEYGAILVSLESPDRHGQMGDINLGFDDLASYLKRNPLFGAVVGRYANRIAGAKFDIDGVTYSITSNAGKNHIHGGGKKRFDKVLWRSYPYETETEVGVRLTHFSFAGEEGFPGNLSCSVTYAVTKLNELRIDYVAHTDKPTVYNVTNHSYFNLAGEGQGDVLDHEVVIHAEWYTPPGPGLIPTGEIYSVTGTPLDFRTPHTIGERIGKLTETRGYDHNYVLKSSGHIPILAARVSEPKTGRVMEVFTTEPGVQFYTANGLRTKNAKGGKAYKAYGGFCLETQHFPDSPNKPHFPSTLLRPGQPFKSTTIFKMSVK